MSREVHVFGHTLQSDQAETSQSFGQGMYGQGIVFSDAGQAVPPYLGWVRFLVYLRLPPVPQETVQGSGSLHLLARQSTGQSIGLQ
jgi:hypothetical protein